MKWRGNRERIMKRRGNGERMMKWWGNGERFTLYISSFSLNLLPLCSFPISKFVRFWRKMLNTTLLLRMSEENLTGNNSGSSLLRGSSASCARLISDGIFFQMISNLCNNNGNLCKISNVEMSVNCVFGKLVWNWMWCIWWDFCVGPSYCWKRFWPKPTLWTLTQQTTIIQNFVLWKTWGKLSKSGITIQGKKVCNKTMQE